eukprot:SAG31_NODE_10271_length_1162_cov_1.371590_1_plen_139_part_00
MITAVGKNGAKDKAEQLFEEAARTLPLQQGEEWPNKFVYAAAFGATKVDFKRSLRCGRTLCKGCPGCGCANWGQFIHVNGRGPARSRSFRWVRETKELEMHSDKKKTYGRTKMSMVKAGDTPWWPPPSNTRQGRTFSH